MKAVFVPDICTFVPFQVLTVSEVVDRVSAWMQRSQCCTAGTLSVLRQVSPVLSVLLFCQWGLTTTICLQTPSTGKIAELQS